LLWV